MLCRNSVQIVQRTRYLHIVKHVCMSCNAWVGCLDTFNFGIHLILEYLITYPKYILEDLFEQWYCMKMIASARYRSMRITFKLHLHPAALFLYSGIHEEGYLNLSSLINDSIALINVKIILNALFCSEAIQSQAQSCPGRQNKTNMISCNFCKLLECSLTLQK